MLCKRMLMAVVGFHSVAPNIFSLCLPKASSKKHVWECNLYESPSFPNHHIFGFYSEECRYWMKSFWIHPCGFEGNGRTETRESLWFNILHQRAPIWSHNCFLQCENSHRLTKPTRLPVAWFAELLSYAWRCDSVGQCVPAQPNRWDIMLTIIVSANHRYIRDWHLHQLLQITFTIYAYELTYTWGGGGSGSSF